MRIYWKIALWKSMAFCSKANDRETAVFRKYAVNTESLACSQAGVRIIEAGGNALDAAIGAALCIGVVNPFSSGIGGGGFMLIKKKRPNEKSIYEMFDFRETAPDGATKDKLQNGNTASKLGGLAVGVPGEIRGFYVAHKEHGRLPWKKLFREAIRLAQGFEVCQILEEKLERNKELILGDPGMSKVFTRKGQLVKKGESVVRNELAETLEEIAKDPESFYTGKIADKIVKAVQSKGGVITREDLKKYEAKKREVLRGRFKDYSIYTTSLPTAGALVLGALNVLKRINFEGFQELPMEKRKYAFYHLLIETFKFVSAKRGKLGDPDFIKNPQMIISEIISEKTANEIFEKIKEMKPFPDNEYGPRLPFKEDHGTTHLNTADEDGMVVLLTSTINLEFGAKFMDPETGIIFNNQIDDFSIPGVRSAYDLTCCPGNIIEKGKRPFSSAAPLILEKEDEIIAIGASGGTRIPTAIIGTLAYVFLGASLSRAVAGTRIHNQLTPATTFVEENFPSEVWDSLVQRGQSLQVSKKNTKFTAVQAMQIKIFADGSRSIIAISDYRKSGKSLGL